MYRLLYQIPGTVLNFRLAYPNICCAGAGANSLNCLPRESAGFVRRIWSSQSQRSPEGRESRDSKFYSYSRMDVPKAETEAQPGSNSLTYDYDLVVIGGGSGGLAASKVRLALVRKSIPIVIY